jgi:hypothetical protein
MEPPALSQIKRELMHLCLDWPAAALADIPQVGELLTSKLPRVDEILA